MQNAFYRLKESEEVCRRLLDLDELNAGARYLMALCREHDGRQRGERDEARDLATTRGWWIG